MFVAAKLTAQRPAVNIVSVLRRTHGAADGTRHHPPYDNGREEISSLSASSRRESSMTGFFNWIGGRGISAGVGVEVASVDVEEGRKQCVLA